MKKEVKQKTQMYQLKIWNKYKYNKKDDDWGQHLRKWKIKGSKRWYQEELRYLNKQQNQMRILLYTGKLPTNSFLHYNLKQEQVSEFCECCDFGGTRREDTIRHRINDCIANTEQIQGLREEVKKWYMIAGKEFKNDTTDPEYIKQFIFPEINDPYIRMKIVKLTIDFLLFNDPGLIRLAEKYY